MKISGKVSNRFNRYLMMVVSILGVCSTGLLLTDPLISDASNNPSLFNADLQKPLNREIANVEDLSPDTLFELNCGEKEKKLETTSRRFRLKGQTCAEEAVALSTQIQNKSNGYVATVFHRDPQSFTTDYINLNEGANEIAVKFDTLHGPVEQTILITRNPSVIKKSN